MKTILFFFLAAIFLTACKKNGGSGSKETVLSKIIKNGKLTDEFIYSSKKKLIRINSYDELTGQFDYATGFEYDATGRLVLEKDYSQPSKVSGQTIYTWGPGEKIIQHEYTSLSGADSGQITVRVKYTYDAAGRISKQSWVDLVTDKTYTSRDLTYYNNGNLRSSAVYYYTPAPELKWQTDYSPEGNPVPPGLIKTQGFPLNFLLYDLVAGEEHSYVYNNGQVSAETNDIFSNRQYDEKGYVLKQTVTRKNILPAGPDKISEMKYEYVQL